MDLSAWSLLGLFVLVITSYITNYVFNITKDEFYSYFHLTAGILSAFFFFSFTGNFLWSIILTVLLGIAWEIYEWYEWKVFLKKKKYQPQADDTRNDLIVDFVGSLLGVAAMALWTRSGMIYF